MSEYIERETLEAALNQAYNTAVYVRCGNYCPNCGAMITLNVTERKETAEK